MRRTSFHRLARNAKPLAGCEENSHIVTFFGGVSPMDDDRSSVTFVANVGDEAMIAQVREDRVLWMPERARTAGLNANKR